MIGGDFALGRLLDRQARANTSKDVEIKDRVPLMCRIDTLDELEYFKNDGILPYVLRQLAA